MANGKHQSIIGEIGSFIGLSFAGIGVGMVAAMSFYLIGLGKSLIPGWVGYACIPLWAAALYVAVAKRDWRGLAVGLVVMVPALFNLGMAEAVGAREMSSDPSQSLAHAIAALMRFVAVGCPLEAGVMAISFPLLLPRRSAQSQQWAQRSRNSGNRDRATECAASLARWGPPAYDTLGFTPQAVRGEHRQSRLFVSKP